ncbi:Rhodanese-like domain-containing protein [Trichoderma barbatum]
MASSAQQDSPVLAFEEIPASDVSCGVIEPSEVYESIEHIKKAGDHAQKDFLLVDVRRNDWEGGTIATSLNLPAQSLYHTRSGVYQLCKQAGIKKVIFYCGSCGTRGPKCAGWFQEYLSSVGETEMTALILKGGVKGWQKTYNGQNMDHYDPNAWDSQSK